MRSQHGHNYIVVLELSASPEDLTEAGFVRDYGELDEFEKWIDDTLDHQHLNEAMGGGSPSAENLEIWIYNRWIDRFPELTAVKISETPRTWAIYRPGARPPEAGQ